MRQDNGCAVRRAHAVDPWLHSGISPGEAKLVPEAGGIPARRTGFRKRQRYAAFWKHELFLDNPKRLWFHPRTIYVRLCSFLTSGSHRENNRASRKPPKGSGGQRGSRDKERALRLDAKASSGGPTLKVRIGGGRIGLTLATLLFVLLFVPAVAAAAVPVVTHISPSQGPASGGVSVTIEGSNFEPTTTSVKFGGVPSAGGVQFISASLIKAQSPAHAAGQVDIIVTTSGGTSSAVPADLFTYNPPHPLLETFGSASQPTFTKPAGMAVDPASGDLYVIDLSEEGLNGTLHRFEPNGEPDPFSALGTNVIDGAGGEDATPSGEVLGNEGFFGFMETQVAIAPPDAAGGTADDIYVTDATNGVVDVFAPSGKYIGQQAVASHPCGVAVDPSGLLYIGDREGGGRRCPQVHPDCAGIFQRERQKPAHL